jgi:hypothetical protein
VVWGWGWREREKKGRDRRDTRDVGNEKKGRGARRKEPK